jgi:uncharacterized glyoxalase superfamily protein PhnB
MEKLQIPEGYQTVMPYLILDNADAFFSFTAKVFDAREKLKYLNDDGSLQHGEIMIGDSTIMFGNSTKDWGVQNAGLYINVANADSVFQKALDNGAGVLQEMSDKPYGRTGGITDPFGNVWWITTPA